MLINNQNVLSPPQALEVPAFEEQLSKFKAAVINHIAQSDADLAEQVAITLNNEAEISTKVIEACTVVLQAHIRKENEKATQMFGAWANDNNLDAVVSNLGLERQIIHPGDASAFPPIAATKESDEHLRQRYFLAPYSFSNAGPGLGYKYHAMTLGERPEISVESPEANKVVVTYQFQDNSLAGQIKDAAAHRTDKGKVTVTVLSREADGTASSELLNSVRAYFQRDDVAPLTDDITVGSALTPHYTINAIVYIGKGPDKSVIQADSIRLCREYADSQHRLNASIETTRISQALHTAGARRIELLSPLEAIPADEKTAAYCTSVNVEVRTE